MCTFLLTLITSNPVHLKTGVKSIGEDKKEAIEGNGKLPRLSRSWLLL